MPYICSWCCINVDSIDNRNFQEQEKETRTTTWRDLMTATGPNLWAVRHALHLYHSISSSNDEHDSNGLLLLPISDDDVKKKKAKKPRKCLRLLWNESTFQHYEEEQGMDKVTMMMNGTTNSQQQLDQPRTRQPLTKCTGETWRKYRPIVCEALQNVPKLSLQATKQVDWRALLQQHAASSVAQDDTTILTVDFKQVVVEAAELWNRRLFVGDNNTITSSEEYQELLETATLEHWKEIRAMDKNQESIQTTLLKLEGALPWNHFGMDDGAWQYSDDGGGGAENKGLLQALFECPRLSPQQATDNAINAMIASLDAVQALVFWTLWNLSRHKPPGAWERCNIASETNIQHDLLQLSIFKKQATQGKTIQLKKPSFLVCALIETFRVYPPVWTLPRTILHNNNNHDDKASMMACKFDVLLYNRATDRQWNPSVWLHGNVDYKIASFGLGKRHCPAGTGGLYAAYELIRSFISGVCSKIDECQPDQALNYAYLGPTLCTHGPQLFQVTLREPTTRLDE